MFAKSFLLLQLAGCGPMPAPPPQTDLWAVQVSETVWRLEVPGWIPVEAPTCWKLGRVPLVVTDDAKTPGVHEPAPWVEGLDYPEGAPCPAAAAAGCWKRPWPWVTPST